jgi:hypothetical protein
MLKAEATQRQHHASSSIAADKVRSQENWKHCHSHTKQGIFQTFHHLDYLRLTNVIAFVNSKKYNLKVLDNGATTFGRRPYKSKQGCGMTPASARYKSAEIDHGTCSDSWELDEPAHSSAPQRTIQRQDGLN